MHQRPFHATRTDAGVAPVAAPPDSRPSAIAARGLTKFYGADRAVDRVNFSVAQGEFLTLLGPSGCGKTTVLRMIAGFLRPDAGSVLINGAPTEGVPPHRRSIGMVFQRLALFPHMTVEQNVAYPLRMRGIARGADAAGRVAAYLKIVRLESFGQRYAHELSGGQQQRVAIARALVFEPEILLLDEPLSSLDRKLREEMLDEFKRIQSELRVTTINVTHDQKEALRLSDRIVVMNRGAVEQTGAPEEIYRRPASLFVAGFVGAPNIIAGSAAARLMAGGAAAVTCALRPEQIRLGAAAAGLDHVVSGTVRAVEFEGDRYVVAVDCADLAGLRLRATHHDPLGGTRYPIGSDIKLGWNKADLTAFH